MRTHQVVFSSRVNSFVLLQLSASNRCRQSLSLGGLGPRGLNQVHLNLSAEGVVGCNATDDGIQVEMTNSADETQKAIKAGVSLWMMQNEPTWSMDDTNLVKVIPNLVKEVSSGVYKIRGDVALLMVAETQTIEFVTATGSYRSGSDGVGNGSWKVRVEDTKTANRPGHISVIYNNTRDTSRHHSNQISRSIMTHSRATRLRIAGLLCSQQGKTKRV